MKEKFTATAKLIVVQKSDSATAQNYTYSDQQLSQKLASTYSQIIMSEAISDPVIANLDLFNKYGISSSQYNNIVKVSAANNTEVMNVSVTTNDPVLSADIANEVVNVFESKIFDIMQVENVTTLSNAKIPTKKSGPSTTRNTAIGGLIGLVICGIITVIQLLTDTKVKTEDEVKKIFDYPIIGSIPDFEIRDTEVDADDE
jgi:capsular polysaccharide biosynthesis protein